MISEKNLITLTSHNENDHKVLMLILVLIIFLSKVLVGEFLVYGSFFLL